jgi:hypothetical protein
MRTILQRLMSVVLILFLLFPQPASAVNFADVSSVTISGNHIVVSGKSCAPVRVEAKLAGETDYLVHVLDSGTCKVKKAYTTRVKYIPFERLYVNDVLWAMAGGR